MSRDRKQMGGLSFIVARGVKPEPLVPELAWSSRAFNIGLAVGAIVGALALCASVGLVLRYGADVPLTLAVVRAQ